ncbi:EscU/YscU/HrcU family type III secretion system export apparatus switch protein [Agromyces humi]|uniref:EscU/YscU/HrcU family type III secretion system export apparatus switch protein n=1 Tax=Agromyces humi TaxID=1766800 RepID=UPI0013586FCB|nr:EscU/YscU/HrcU family type III secretion system export apparatus switch protein [Agromyces humi]
MSDSEERTEQASQKRMKDVREKGKLQKSQDVTAWLGIGAAAAVLPATIASAASATSAQIHQAFAVTANPNPEAAVEMLGQGLGSVLGILGMMLAVVAVAVIVGSAAQGGIHPRKFKGKYEQFNLVAGVKRVFGLQSLWQGVKALLKTAVVGLALYLVIQALMPVLTQAGGLNITSLLEAAASGVTSLLVTAVAAGLIIAGFDVFVVWKKNRKQTMMTKKEVRDEMKNSDGDPLIKAQRRSRQLAMSRNRMIAAVADADVVLVNPTHVAVALKYEAGKGAPRVVAKGKGAIASRIRQEAERKNVPMVKDVPLARAIHDTCKLGHEIPVDLYQAVALVLHFVAALKRRGSISGIHTMNRPTLTLGATT